MMVCYSLKKKEVLQEETQDGADKILDNSNLDKIWVMIANRTNKEIKMKNQVIKLKMMVKTMMIVIFDRLSS